MEINRKSEAIARLLWLVENEVENNLPQHDEDATPEDRQRDAWIDEFNREMGDALAIVTKMYEEVRFEKMATQVARQARVDHPHLSYDKSLTLARQAVREQLRIVKESN